MADDLCTEFAAKVRARSDSFVKTPRQEFVRAMSIAQCRAQQCEPYNVVMPEPHLFSVNRTVCMYRPMMAWEVLGYQVQQAADILWPDDSDVPSFAPVE